MSAIKLCEGCGLPLKDGQARCLRCGRPIEGDASPKPAGEKKKHVYESICGKCGALLPDDCGVCLICGTGREEIPYDGQFPVAIEGEPYRAPPYQRQESRTVRSYEAMRRWGGGLAALLLAVVVAITGFGVWQRYFDTSGYRAAESVLYETEGGTLWLNSAGLSAPVEVTGIELGGSPLGDCVLQAGKNGRYLFVTTGAGELYQIDFGQRLSGELSRMEAVLLAEGLSGPAILSESGDWLAYHTGGNELYATDYKDRWRLDTGVDRLVAVEDRRVLYTRREESGGRLRTDLYLNQLGVGGGEWVLLDRDIQEILDWTPGFERVLYTGISQQDGRLSLSLLSYEGKANAAELLAEGISVVIDASAADKSALYLVDSPRLWSYNQFIDDDLASADALIFKPALDEYPELAEAIHLYGEDANLAEIAESEGLIIESNAYEAAMRRWEEKTARDEIRRSLHSLFAAQSGEKLLMELYAYRMGERILLDDGVLPDDTWANGNADADAQDGYIVYQSIDPASLRRIKLSALWQNGGGSITDLRQHYIGQTRRELKYAGTSGRTASLFIRSDSLVHKLWQTADRGSGVYFTVGPAGEPGERDELFYASMRGAGGNAVKVAQQVNAIYGAYRSGIVYGATDRTLSVALDGAASLIGGGDSKFGSLENGGATLLYFEAFSEQGGSGALAMRTKEQVSIGRDIVGYAYQSDQLVYLQKDNGQGGPPDLYVWSGGEGKLLAERPRGVAYPEGPDGARGSLPHQN